MGDAAIELTGSAGRVAKFPGRIRALLGAVMARRRERRQVQRWLRHHPPSLGRSTGARV